MGRPKKAATIEGGNAAKQDPTNIDNAENDQNETKTKEADLAEKVTPTVEELQAVIAKLKADKVVEVKTKTPKGATVIPPRSRNQGHTVYVAKKKGDEWGEEQEREMSEQAYNAIAKDLSLKVRLPKDSRLSGPQSKGCTDC